MIDEIGQRAKDASHSLRESTGHVRQTALEAMSSAVLHGEDEILSANEADMDLASAEGITGALLDRLRLTPDRVAAMSRGLATVASLPDPVGRETGGWSLYNGAQLHRVRVPLGVIAVIYEARPNVTSDAAGLCIKSGNAVILRGSSYALGSNTAIAGTLRDALGRSGLPEDGVQLLQDTGREGAKALMQATNWVDLLVPRGGPGLVDAVRREATVPTVIDGAGNCHVYVDSSADLDKAMRIVLNAKVQRPGVCNAAEKLLVHRDVAAGFLPDVIDALRGEGVEVRGDAATAEIVDDVIPAVPDDWSTEYLDLVIAIAVVPDVEAAVTHVRMHGTGHTEVIVTEDRSAANRFVVGVDSGVVGVNVSTRFTDGEQFGFGAEIGNSTQKLHVRGPMGLESLTSERYVLYGDGQVR
jgi:glutamate-5-semialdehyde dehydrogenase